jgi:hypothetical protein
MPSTKAIKALIGYLVAVPKDKQHVLLLVLTGIFLVGFFVAVQMLSKASVMVFVLFSILVLAVLLFLAWIVKIVVNLSVN